MTELGNGKWRVELATTVAVEPTTFTVMGDSDDEIEDITIDADVPQFVFINVHGSSALDPVDSVELIDSDDSTGTVLIDALTTVNDVGSIRVNNILGTDIGGDVTGLIECRERDGGGDSNLEMMVDGSVLGNVDVSYGAILGLEIGGSLGTSGSPVTVTTDKKIESIEADEIHASISTDTDVFVQHIETAGASSNGDFTGSLSTKNLTYDGSPSEPRGITVKGDLEADLSFGDQLAEPVVVHGDLDGDIDATSRIAGDIIIGGSLNGDLTVSASAELDGFVVIDADDDGTGSWVGDVSIGGYTLGPSETGASEAPDYTVLRSNIGDGAVGVVDDWGFHGTDTFPADGIVTGQPQFQDDSTVRIFHYGPIDGTVYDDLKIEKNDGGSWTDVTSEFEFGFDAGSTRELRIDPKDGESWEAGFDYRVTHEAGDLQIPSDVLIGSGNVDVGAYTYEFCYSN